MNGIVCCFMIVFCLLAGTVGQAQAQGVMARVAGAQPTTAGEVFVDTTWKNFEMPDQAGVSAIVAERDRVDRELKSFDEGAFVRLFNGSKAISRAARFLQKHKDARVDAGVLKELLDGVDLHSEDIARCPAYTNVVDDYYALKAIMEGASVEEAWGAMRLNLIMETVDSPWDYRKYQAILELNNPALSQAYLECLLRVFRYNGSTEGLEKLRPAIERWMPAGKLKEEIIASYAEFASLRAGEIAPAFKLEDYAGGEYALEGFRGKVLVVDVWATWCSGCIEKLPKFREMRESYKDREDIEFITISIDRQAAYPRWKELVEKHELVGMKSLFAPKETSSFQEDYHITGIPRYLVIDREGRIVSVYTPTSGPLFKEMIEGALGL